MKRAIVTAVLAVILLSTSCARVANGNLAPLSSGDIEDRQFIETNGVIKAVDVKNIIINFPAKINKILVMDGQRVIKGQPLVTLDLSDTGKYIQELENQLSLAVAELDRLNSNYEDSGRAVESNFKSLNYSINSLQSQIQELNQEMSAKKKALEFNEDPEIRKLIIDIMNAEQAYNRLKDSAANGQNSTALEEQRKLVDNLKASLDVLRFKKQEEIRNIQKDIDNKSYQLSVARAQLDSLQSSDETGVNSQEAKVASLESTLNDLKGKLALSYFKDNNIISEIDGGIIDGIGYMPGENISPSRKILSVVDPEKMIIEAYIPEELIRDVKIGSEVLIVPERDKSREYHGKVTRILNLAVKQSGKTMIPIEIKITDRDDLIIPNLNVNLKVSTK